MHSVVEVAQKSWFSLEPFTLISTYQNLQQKFTKLYSPYDSLVKKYRLQTKNQIYLLSSEYLNNNPQVAEENVALLKNSIELWRNGAQTTDAIAPILFHYSWHCLNSFFAYTFFRWKPEHSQSHGIRISNLSDNVKAIKIMLMENGMFQRMMDTWTCLGAFIAFSEYIPMFDDDSIGFQKNKAPITKKSRCFNLEDLMSFDSFEYERKYWKDFGRENLTQNGSFRNSMGNPSEIIRSYCILFAASSIARYRPILWRSILSGVNEDKAEFAIAYRSALLKYAQFGVNSTSFLNEISSLFHNLMKDSFEIKCLPQ